ncbi:TRAP transporter substrate-binding protein [uncultured Azohydromonas sp.]|jgi:tripartite ATP-independent periplasmic transporter solute receptor, DctP family|uniref:TRAP transporter substrate-binding protein n=1 Tax=uncultured Azohydromonas sp. TaxID=487342 RepID=UPI002635649F|nr:TRAP transporter substrate-binding protein [uncultured Azohydromonas sp.]
MSINTFKRAVVAGAIGTLFLGVAATGALAADIKERSIKLPIVNQLDHPQGLGAKKFADVVSAKSGGKLKVKIFPGGTLGGEQQVASAMQGGTVEASMMSPAQLVGMIKEFVLLDFPFAFANEREADFVLDGPVGKKLLDKMPEKGLVGLVYMEQGYRSITNSKRPIQKMEDIQGLKIRTILNPLYIDMLNTLGANAVPMPFPELYTAMESKAVDGQENPYSTAEASKFYEVQKYMSNTRHIYNPQMLLVSKKFWDGLSADEKKIIQDAAVEARDYQRKVAREMDQKSRQELIKHGMQINDIAPAELQRMRDKVKPVVDKYAAQVGQPLVKEFQAELEKARVAAK